MKTLGIHIGTLQVNLTTGIQEIEEIILGTENTVEKNRYIFSVKKMLNLQKKKNPYTMKETNLIIIEIKEKETQVKGKKIFLRKSHKKSVLT